MCLYLPPDPIVPGRGFFVGKFRAVSETLKATMSKRKHRDDDSSEAPCWASGYTPPKTKEKRLERWRSHASQASSDRIGRALSQRMYLLEEEARGDGRLYKILGSTGNVYDVTIDREPSCSCPDARKGNICKHIFFVMVRVLRCDRDAPIVHQKALLSSELRALFDRCDGHRWRPPEANDATKRAYLEATGRTPKKKQRQEEPPPPVDDDSQDDCAICFEPLGTANLTRCQNACKKALHAECLRKWARAAKGNVTCPTCRAPWIFDDASSATSKTGSDHTFNEGYLNLAATQGQDRHRDTSTYRVNPFFSSHRRGSWRRGRRGW